MIMLIVNECIWWKEYYIEGTLNGFRTKLNKNESLQIHVVIMGIPLYWDKRAKSSETVATRLFYTILS